MSAHKEAAAEAIDAALINARLLEPTRELRYLIVDLEVARDEVAQIQEMARPRRAKEKAVKKAKKTIAQQDVGTVTT
jgi:hypothetical protein